MDTDIQKAINSIDKRTHRQMLISLLKNRIDWEQLETKDLSRIFLDLKEKKVVN